VIPREAAREPAAALVELAEPVSSIVLARHAW